MGRRSSRIVSRLSASVAASEAWPAVAPSKSDRALVPLTRQMADESVHKWGR